MRMFTMSGAGRCLRFEIGERRDRFSTAGKERSSQNWNKTNVIALVAWNGASRLSYLDNVVLFGITTIPIFMMI